MPFRREQRGCRKPPDRISDEELGRSPTSGLPRVDVMTLFPIRDGDVPGGLTMQNTPASRDAACGSAEFALGRGDRFPREKT